MHVIHHPISSSHAYRFPIPNSHSPLTLPRPLSPLSAVIVQRAAKGAKLRSAVPEQRVKLASRKLKTLRRDRRSSAKGRRHILRGNLVQQTGHTRRVALEHVPGDRRAKLANADEAVGLSRVAAEGDGMALVLREDLNRHVGDRVGVDAGVPIRRQLLLLEKIVHGGLVGFAEFAERGEEFAGGLLRQDRCCNVGGGGGSEWMKGG